METVRRLMEGNARLRNSRPGSHGELACNERFVRSIKPMVLVALVRTLNGFSRYFLGDG